MKKETNASYYTTALPYPSLRTAAIESPALERTRVVGQVMPRVDAYERVSGAAVYPSDVSLPGMITVGFSAVPILTLRSSRSTLPWRRRRPV